MRALHARELFRRPDGDHAPAGVAAFRTEIDHPVGALHDLQVVLDDERRVAALDQPVEGSEEIPHVVKMESRRRFVEEEERRLLLARRGGDMGGQLETLRLASREGGERLTEPRVVETNGDERLECRDDLRALAEELRGLGDRRLENVADRALAYLGLQHFRAETSALAFRAWHVNVREELHLDLLVALAPAGLAPPALDVERERRGGVAA